MDSVDCLREVPAYYKNIMSLVHTFTLPIYFITLSVLYREPSKAFKTYKNYIFVHIAINIVTEIFVSYFMLPDTYLPLPIMRMTGLMAYWGFNGLVIFYIIAQLVILTGGSIIEMFYYRFKVCVIYHETQLYSKILKFQMYLYRFTQSMHPVIMGVTYKPAADDLIIARDRLWMSNSTFISPEVRCFNVMTTDTNFPIYWFVFIYYSVQVLNCIFICIGSLIYITDFINKSIVMSKATEKLQKMLLFSLFIQTAIHGVLIILPLLVVAYALAVDLPYDDFARVMIIFFAYHGFASTCAMIIFTKPLRDKILPCTKTLGQTKQISVVQASSTQDGPNS